MSSRLSTYLAGVFLPLQGSSSLQLLAHSGCCAPAQAAHGETGAAWPASGLGSPTEIDLDGQTDKFCTHEVEKLAKVCFGAKLREDPESKIALTINSPTR